MLKVEGMPRYVDLHPRYKKAIAAVMLVVFGWVFFVLTQTSLATGISQGYSTTDQDLRQNMIAALSTESTAENPLVERASGTNRSNAIGVVTTIDANLLTLTNSAAKVHIATSGEALTYVTDLNGAIKKGDFIAVSPITGVGMKASDSDIYVIGIALEDFNSETAESQQVSTTQGSERTVLINRVKLNVEPKELSQAAAKANSTPFLLLFGQSVTGKSVSQTQVLVAMTLFLLLLIVEGSIIYGAIHSTIVSIGRNPLARTALYRQLLQVSWLSLLVLMFGAGSIYAILWL